MCSPKWMSYCPTLIDMIHNEALNNSRPEMPYKNIHRMLKSQASQVAQMVKNLPAMCETWVESLDQEDPLE